MDNLTDDLKTQLRRSVIFLLKPLVRILLRSGVGLSEFTEWAKFAYVDVAEQDFSPEKKVQSTSRIAILTGMHRKEVARIRKELELGGDPVTKSSANRAERVIKAWMREKEFVDGEGMPLLLPLDTDASEFGYEQLVSRFSGDIHPATLLAELKRIDAVEELEGKVLKLKAQGYTPVGSSVEQLQIFGQATSDLLATMDRNLDADVENNFFQKTVSYRNLSQETAEAFREFSKEENNKLLIKLNKWLAARTAISAEHKEDSCLYRAGVGVYYLEESYSNDRDLQEPNSGRS